MNYLLFRLYGPMASWGEIAVGESRHSAAYPSKSALLGLLAAALGVRRSDTSRQQALWRHCQFAVKVISTGHLLRDYHTTQVPRAVGKFAYRTRRDELVIGKNLLGTILSNREYRCDALAIIAVKLQEPHDAIWSLETIRQALLKPKFHLYLGRKACPLAAPLNPKIVNGAGIYDVFHRYGQGALHLSSRAMQLARKDDDDTMPTGPWIEHAPKISQLSKTDRYALRIGREPVRYYWEGDAGDLAAQQELVRHDQPISRTRWQFARRSEQLTIRSEDD